MRKEFKSSVADMKNSVKDRMNAQASCAGLFVESHLPKDAPAMAPFGHGWTLLGRGQARYRLWRGLSPGPWRSGLSQPPFFRNTKTGGQHGPWYLLF